MEGSVTIHNAGPSDVSPLKFFHVTRKFWIGYNFFPHQQEAGEILNMHLKFQVNSCMYVDTVIHDVKSVTIQPVDL